MNRRRWLWVRDGEDPVLVRRLSPADLAAIRAAAVKRGYSHARVDLDGCVEKNEFLARIAEQLEFPDWFGRNWDAFFDCLVDLSWRPAPGHVLVLANAADMQRDAPEAFDTGLTILRDAAAVWARRGVPLRSFVDLPAPPRVRRRRLDA